VCRANLGPDSSYSDGPLLTKTTISAFRLREQVCFNILKVI